MNIEDVEKLAELAKLELSQAEKESILHDMEGILGYVKQVEEVEVGDMQASNLHYNSWREDVPAEAKNFSPELIVKQFPAAKDGFLKVKKIL
ncbi:MAG: Asp-tRNA(Asn)/Glu-tRNA(Gln) amidotransferase subunit GatC [Candidatus Pacebacteria bacterium]|nr:Asp-tRNA(Asn)/Glu-tRNA(Gln) amidotransferase subunit GatC [Candidatus Paceibacterota bacterium]